MANDRSGSSPISIAPTRFRNGHGANAVLDGFPVLADALAVDRMEAAALLPLREELERLRVRLADESITWHDLA